MMFNQYLSMKSLLKPAIALLLLLPLSVSAEIYYSIEGEISDINDKAISLDDGYYPFLPTIKVIKLNGEPGGIMNLKKGDYIKMTILNMDRKRQVDKIEQIPELDKK